MHKNQGFTLIELMIVVAVIGILASIGYPSYVEYVAKSRRAVMTGVLSQGQQWMERFYTENFSYLRVRGSTATSLQNFPSNLKSSPAPSEGSANYSVALDVSEDTPDSYSLSATRTGSMASDRCGDFSIDQYGRKKIENYDTTKFASLKSALDYCWK